MIGNLIALALAGTTLAVMTPTPLALQEAAAVATREDLAYGRDPRQMITLYRLVGARPAPLIVYIHGGGWIAGDRGAGGREKPAHFTREGFVYATIGYRLVPQVRVEEQIADVARGIAWLRKNARRLGINPDRIVLMGHSSGAHLAAMLGTDPRYLRAAGVPFDSVVAEVLIDGAGYDVPQIMASSPGIMRFYGPAFGPDRARQEALSPVNHTAPPNVRAWQMLYDRNRLEAGEQTRALADGLAAAGATVVTTGVTDSNHMQLNENLGFYGDFATNAVDMFLNANVRHNGGLIPLDDER